MDAPETVTEAVQLLQSQGYGDDFSTASSMVHCAACGAAHEPTTLTIRETFRFEGPSDPADEAIVLGVECPVCGSKGIIVSAYGPDVDDAMLRLLAHVRRGS